MKNFCEFLREHAKSIIDFEKKNMLPLTRKELKSHEDENVCSFCGIRLSKKILRDKNYRKFRYHCHYTGKYREAAYSTCNLKSDAPNEVPAVFLNGSNYDYQYNYHYEHD